jgi:hypothetical protein
MPLNQQRHGPETQSYKYVHYQFLEENEDSSIRSYRSLNLCSKPISFPAGIATDLLLTLLYLPLQNSLSSPRQYIPDTVPDEDWNHCGWSSKVAIEKGCIMEPLFYGWMPSQCVFKELSDRFPVFEDQTWYTDPDLSIPIPPEELWRGEHDPIYTKRFVSFSTPSLSQLMMNFIRKIEGLVITRNTYHGEHCLFQWRKLQYAMHNQKEFIDNKTVSLRHSGHCADELSTWFDGLNEANIVELGFYRCRKTIW